MILVLVLHEESVRLLVRYQPTVASFASERVHAVHLVAVNFRFDVVAVCGGKDEVLAFVLFVQ